MKFYSLTLRCTYCQKLFDKRNILKRHYREKHFCGNVYKCNMCTVSFVRKERLIRHLKSVHFNIKYHCEECGMNFVEKYKQNFHLVHSHGYSYCSTCKVAYRTYKPIDQLCNSRDCEGEAKTENNENEHVCSIYIQYYKCFVGNCKGRKTYNRLNFFIRHLQLEHQISEFQRVKDIIDESTFETRSNRSKSKIRARTLEGPHDDNISEDLKELFDYAKLNILSAETFDDCPSANEILKRLISEKESEVDNESRSNEDDFQSPDDQNFKEEELEQATFMETGGNPSLKELIQNINIMCMMESNFKKAIGAKLKEEIVQVKKVESEEITLGKRGRPSKISSASSFCLAETVVETFLHKFEEMDTRSLHKLVKRQRPEESFDRDLRERRQKEKKKIKPIYFDDILLETLSITDRVERRETVFAVRRNCTFFVMNGRVESREGSQRFVEPDCIKVRLEASEDDEFEQIYRKMEETRRVACLKMQEEAKTQGEIQIDKWKCGLCRSNFFNCFARIEHSSVCRGETVNKTF